MWQYNPATGRVRAYTTDAAPRALLAHRQLITIWVSPTELHMLIKALEAEAAEAIEEGRDGYADYLLVRCAQLREAAQ